MGLATPPSSFTKIRLLIHGFADWRLLGLILMLSLFAVQQEIAAAEPAPVATPASPATPAGPVVSAAGTAKADAKLMLYDSEIEGSSAAEAARWKPVAPLSDACVSAASNAITITLPNSAALPNPPPYCTERALTTDADAPFNADAFAALRMNLYAAEAGPLDFALIDAEGKRTVIPVKLSAGRQTIWLLLRQKADAITAADVKRLSRLSVSWTAPTMPKNAQRSIIVYELSFGSVDPGEADEIKNSWVYGFLSHYGYLAFFCVLILISLGIPLPEEIFLLTAGYLAHQALTHPEIGINVHIITVVCFLGILGGDSFVYSLGRYKGEKVRQWRLFRWLLPDKSFVKVRAWFDRWGVGATAAFRFIPPIRMPGFFAAGLLRQSPISFLLADGIACMISIPTQIYLVFYLGDYVIPYVKKFNLVLIIGLVVFIVGYAIYEIMHKKKEADSPGGADGTAANAQSATGIAALDGADASHLHTKHSHHEGSETPANPRQNPAGEPPAKPPGN